VVRRGRQGVVAQLRGPSVATALDRTASGLAAYIGEQQHATHTVASSVATFRAWLSSSFLLAVEVGRIRDGAPRVLRICELGVDKLVDLHSFNPEPPPMGTFAKCDESLELGRVLERRGH
jgi:hypothetical protein